jgi:hypothetical protein
VVGAVAGGNFIVAVFEAAFREGEITTDGAWGADVVHAANGAGEEDGAGVVGTLVRHVHEILALLDRALGNLQS